MSYLFFMDETDKARDRRLVPRLQDPFSTTETGRRRTTRIVPVPLFVASDMTYPIQAADVCVHAIDRGFRLPSAGMNAPTRPEIAEQFRPRLCRGWQ